MARPRKEGFEYFPHNTSSMSDEKLDLLVTMYGAKGYAFYFLHLEYIYRNEDLAVNVNGPVFRKLICAKLQITPEEYDEILHAALDIDLFDAEHFKETGKLVSKGVFKRVEAVLKEREGNRNRQQRFQKKQRNNKDITPLPDDAADYNGVITEPNAASQKVTPEREKEKEKEICTPPTPCSPPSPPPGDGADGDEPEADAMGQEPPPPAPTVPPCPQQSIIALYHEILPTCPKVRAWSKGSGAKLASRWREDKQRQNLDWWRVLFMDIAQSDFLMGRAPTKDGRPFTFSLTWLVGPTNFEKVLNGNYQNRASPQQPRPQYPQRLSPNQAYMLEIGRYMTERKRNENRNDNPGNGRTPPALPGGGA